MSHEYPINVLYATLAVSASGYHAWAQRAPGHRAQANAALLSLIAQTHRESRQTYGSSRITRWLLAPRPLAMEFATSFVPRGQHRLWNHLYGYASWDTVIGAKIESGKDGFKELEAYVLKQGEGAPNASDRQEFLETRMNEFV